MKILYLTDDFPPKSFGGAGIVSYNFAKIIKDLGHDVYVITATQDKNEEGLSVQDGLKVFRVYSNYHRRWRAYISLYNPQTVRKVSKIISDIKPDIIHSQNIHLHLSLYCLRIAKLTGVPVFLTAHDVMLVSNGKIKIPETATCDNFMEYCKISGLSQLKEYKRRYNPFRNSIIRFYLRNYIDKIFAFSNAQKKVLINNGLNNLEVIHSAIDADSYAVDLDMISAFKKKHNLEGRKLILFGGRMTVEKGVDEVLKSLEVVSKKVPDALLVVAGVGGDNLEDLGLPIKFLGWLDLNEMKVAVAATDIVIFPSICFDVFGMMVLEAMACRKPVVGTCFGGAPEAIIDGVTGFVVNPYDTRNMADKIILLLQDESLSVRFGEAGYIRVKKEFDVNLQASKVLSWYNRLLNK